MKNRRDSFLLTCQVQLLIVYIISKFTSNINAECRILTWNVRGAMSSAGSIGHVLDKYDVDIACICEHKLKPSCSSFLDSIHSAYTAHTNYEALGNAYTCGKGGVSVLVRKSLSFSVDFLNGETNSRVIGIKLYGMNTIPIHIFCVYMPSVNYSLNGYTDCIDSLQGLYDLYSQCGSVLFCGDMNADITKRTQITSDHRQKAFVTFLENNGLKFLKYDGVPFTFKVTEKTLDCILTNHSDESLIKDNIVLDDISCLARETVLSVFF